MDDWREFAAANDAIDRWPGVAAFCRKNCYGTVHHIDCAAWLWDVDGRLRSKTRTPDEAAALGRDDQIRERRSNGETLASIGESVGLTRERVRQIVGRHRGKPSILKRSLGRTRAERKANFKLED